LSDATGTVKLADFGAAKHLDYTELLASVSESDGFASIKGYFTVIFFSNIFFSGACIGWHPNY